jgi:hypothetical protein
MNACWPIVWAALLAGAPEWKVAAPKGAGFSVSLPGEPSEKLDSIKSTQGTIEIRVYSLTSKTGTYVVGRTLYPEVAIAPGNDKERLDQARDGAVKLAKGRINAEKAMTIEGRMARDFFIIGTETGHALKVRLIADRNRLYQLMVVGNSQFLESPEAARFMGSFRLTK